MRSLEGKAFGELLGQFRTEASFTQQQLAGLLGKTRGTIVNWENGTHLPKERALVLELAKHLHLDGLKRDQLLEAALFDPLGTVWTIPFQRNPFFTGREDILNHLQKALNTDKAVALMQPQALKGLGGIGKTHTAIEYAYRHRDEYQTILWAPATTSSLLQASLVSIAEALNLPEKNEREQDVIVKAVKRWMMNHSGWLLILDNVEDLESVQSLYPWAHSGHVIITTRSQSVGGIALSISVEKMEPEEGALLLLRRATLIGSDEGREQAKGTDYEKARELSEVLGGLPLALDQAAAYIENTRCGLTTYLKLYQIERAKLLSERGSLTTDHPESVTVTFFLAFKKVVTASLAAGELLQFCAFLSPDAIPEEIITNGAAYLGSKLEPIATDLAKLNEAIGILLAYSLLHRDTEIETGTQILSIHRLVQAVLQDALKQEEQRRWAERVTLAVNATFPHVEHGTWPQCERLLTQALGAAQWIKQYQFTSEEAGRLLFVTASYLLHRARYLEAESLYQQALRIWEPQLVPGHPRIAPVLTNLASIYYLQGKYTEAESLYEQALHIYEQALRFYKQELGAEYPKVVDSLADTLNGLANTCRSQGKYTEAELLYEQALHIYEQQLGPNKPEAANTLNGLAILCKEQGRYTEAETLYLRALGIREQQLGPLHPDVAFSLNGLANLYKKQGKYTEAKTLYLRALGIREQQLGPLHPDVAYPLTNLASLYEQQGKYTEAEPLYQRALHIFEQQLGPDHPEGAIALNGLAILYSRQGKYAEAEPLYQRTLRIWKLQLGPNHPQVAAVLTNLANINNLLGKNTEAESLYLQALHIYEQQLRPDYPKVADALNGLATLYAGQGKYTEAETLYLQVLRIWKQYLGPDHPKVTLVLTNLACLYRDQGR